MINSQQFKLLDMDAANKFKNDFSLSLSKNIVKYMLFIEYTNKDLIDHLNFERFYNADSQNRTQENEKALHAKRSRAIESLRGFQNTIAEAKTDLTMQLKGWEITSL